MKKFMTAKQKIMNRKKRFKKSDFSDYQLSLAKENFGEKDGKVIVGMQKHTRSEKIITKSKNNELPVIGYKEKTEIIETTI